MKKIILPIVAIMNGNFGKCSLEGEVKFWWQVLTWGFLGVLFLVFIFVPLIEAWSRFIDGINNVIWG